MTEDIKTMERKRLEAIRSITRVAKPCVSLSVGCCEQAKEWLRMALSAVPKR
jgi:hypothetical protein